MSIEPPVEHQKTEYSKFFKITNKNENHHGYQYHDGLNVLIELFQETGSCIPGGFYITTAEHIHKFYDYGIWLREVELPTTDPNFRIVQDPSGDKWRVNMIIMGERHSLMDLKIYDRFKLQPNYIHISRIACSEKCPEVIQLIMTKDSNFLASEFLGVYTSACCNGWIELYKQLMTIKYVHPNIGFLDACSGNHLELVKLMIADGANDFNCGLYRACRNGWIELAQLMINNGANSVFFNQALRHAREGGHPELAKLMISKGADSNVLTVREQNSQT